MSDYFEGYLSECHEYTAVLKRIAELETERAALLAEVKRLTADVKRACAMVGLGRNMDALILLSRMVNSSKPSGDAKRDPISPKDPLERA